MQYYDGSGFLSCISLRSIVCMILGNHRAHMCCYNSIIIARSSYFLRERSGEGGVFTCRSFEGKTGGMKKKRKEKSWNLVGSITRLKFG